MTISVVFDPPLLADSPAVFNSKAFTLVGNLNTFSTQANSTASDINAQVTDPGVVAIGKDLTGANTIGNVSGISANVTTVAGISANVTTVAGISANVTTVADNTANINAAVADLPSLAAKVSKTGDTMTGHLNTIAGASGTQVPQAQEVFLRDGSLLTLTSTSHDITGIPADAKEVFLYFSATVPAVTELKIQLGTSGGIVSTGYTSVSFSVTAAGAVGMTDVTSHISIRATSAGGSSSVMGLVRLTRTKFDTTYGWVADGTLRGIEGANLRVAFVQGQNSLSSQLTQIRILTDGAAMSGTVRYFWRK